MGKALVTEWHKVDGEDVSHSLQVAGEKLDSSEREVVLDFSDVRRVDSNALRQMEKIAGVADSKSIKIELRGVNIDVYKVLKLVRLSQRFSFLA